MRKFVVTLMASLLSGATAFAFWPEAADSSLEVGVGYRQDKVEWKTKAGFDSSYYDRNTYYDSSYGTYYDYSEGSNFTGVRSHVKWHDLNIWQIEAKGKYITCDNIYLRANADYGWITSGKNKDTDHFDFYGESTEFASSHSSTKGNVYDVRLAFGYQFKMCDDSFSIAPLIGYSWHGQHFKDHHCRRWSSSEYLDDGCGCDDSSSSYSYYSSYGNDHGKYKTRWNGFFIGADFDYAFGCWCDWDWQLFGSYEFHWAEYHAHGDWDRRVDLCNGFQHRAKNAYGSLLDLGVKWDFCECWTLALKGEFQWWWADHGHDRAKVAERSVGDVKADCYVKVPLHDVRWYSAAIALDLGMVF